MSERKITETQKRKLNQSASSSGETQKKAREDDRILPSVTDEEVDEFFAILKRIHVAVDYFKNGNKDVRHLTERESLKLDSGNANANVKEDAIKNEANKVTEGVEQNTGFDLNADPELD